MKDTDLRQLFRNNSDCYTQVTTKGLDELTTEQALSEDKFVELVTKILSNERERLGKHEHEEKKCHVPKFNGVNQYCVRPDLNCEKCSYWHL